MACRRSRSHTTRLESPQCALALLLLCRVYGCFAGPVHVDPHVTAVWGKNVTLKCLIEVNETITQFSWEKIIGKGAQTLAVYHPRFGTSFQESYQERTTFRNHSLYDATIIISNIDFSDSGEYICKAVTFPLGNVQSSTTMTVYVEPIVSISKGSDPLLDGANETVAAFCIAAFGKPAAEVYWEESLGKMETNSTSYPNKTVTVISQYKLVPTRFARGRNITCVVRHPAFENDVRYPFKLDIQYAPEVSVTGYDGNWFVGRKNVHLKCNADSNPPPSEMKWTRLDGNWPEGLSSMNNTLLFTHPLTHNVSGTYVCSVSNILGQKSDQKTITILEPPVTTPVPTISQAHSSVDIAGLATTSKRLNFPASTMATMQDGNFGTIIGSVVGGCLFLILLIVLSGVIYYRRKQTFRGDYFTKSYIPPSDMQKESQIDVLQPEDLDPFPDNLKKDIDTKPNDHIYNEYLQEVENPEWNNIGTYRYQEPFERPMNNYVDKKMPIVSRYNKNCYNDNEDDLVSHVDGSVISRREWYV
ncbi:nectin-3 isoform X1 [Bombina bombina]|uniref:nectin-3 isoform X1 n=1 Tax=Bombina bombina TaxID=8345 RepID=UPI00235AA0A4|nr:nectin-3 isoform X1 [Bombina bombina]